jgi:hypothetical protein
VLHEMIPSSHVNKNKADRTYYKIHHWKKLTDEMTYQVTATEMSIKINNILIQFINKCINTHLK